jgi:lysophospholipase L1-like esterase
VTAGAGAPRAELAYHRPAMALGSRTTRWIAAASLAANLAIAAVLGARWVARQRSEPPALPSRERARAELFHAFAGAVRRDVVMLGDSLTDRGEWWELLERPVANRGIAGDTIAGVAARLDDVVALAPRAVFVLIGVNDLLEGAAPEAMAERHARLIAELRRRLPRARIVVESLLPIREALVALDEPLASAAVVRANQLCRLGALSAGADWLDLTPVLADAAGELDARYSSDGLHLSAAGYRAWAAALRPYLP